MTAEEMLKAIADGRPIQLPFKVGDTLYVPFRNKAGGGWINKYICAGFHITSKVTGWHKDKTTIYIVARSEGYGSPRHFDFSTIGHAAFFTEDEARVALNNRR